MTQPDAEPEDPNGFLQGLLDAFDAHVAVLDAAGVIVRVNKAWFDSSQKLGLDPPGLSPGVNVLHFLDDFARRGNISAQRMVDGLRSLLDAKQERFDMQYTHGRLGGPRWFRFRATRFVQSGHLWVVIRHEDITELREAAEEQRRTEDALRTSEASLRASEASLRTMLNAIPEIAFLIDTRYTILQCNQELAKRLGESKDRILGRNLLDAIPPELKASRKAHVDRVIETGVSVRFVDREGERYYDNILSPVQGKGGEVQQVAIISLDITHHKEVEDALRQSEQRFRQVAENAKEIIWEINPDGYYIFINPMVESILGYRPDEVAGVKRFTDLIHPDSRNDVQAKLNTSFMEKQSFRDLLHPVVHKAGQTIHLLTSGVPILDANGELLGYRGADIDITERLQSEQALRDSEARFRLMLEQVPAIVWTTDDALMLTSVMGAGLKALNRPADTMLGQHLPELLEDESDIAALMSMHRSALQGESLSFEYAGEEREYHMHVEPLRDASQEITGCIGIALDITEQKNLERRLLQLSEQERQRIASDLHDGLGQQLIGILYLSRRLREALVTAGRPEARHAGEIAALVNQAVTQARELSRGLSPVSGGPQRLVSGLTQLAASTTLMFDIACRFHGEEDLETGDETTDLHLYRLAQEAVTNAVRHAHATSIDIELYQEAQQLVLAITDDGAGFSLGDKEHPGLGLKTMAYRARLLGGQLDVESNEDGGVTVTCRTPLPRSHSPSLSPQDAL